MAKAQVVQYLEQPQRDKTTGEMSDIAVSPEYNNKLAAHTVLEETLKISKGLQKPLTLAFQGAAIQVSHENNLSLEDNLSKAVVRYFGDYHARKNAQNPAP